MIARAPGQKLGAAGRRALQRHLYCHFHRDGSGIGVEDLRVLVVGQLHEVCGKPRRRFVSEPAEHDVAEPIDLILRRRHQPRVRMAVACRPPGAHAVDDALAIREF